MVLFFPVAFPTLAMLLGAATGSADPGTFFARMMPVLIVLLAITIAGGVLILWIRRSLKSSDEPTGGFGLEDLRRLHRAGRLTDEEFARAKERMLAKRPSRADSTDKLVREAVTRPPTVNRRKPTPPSDDASSAGGDRKP